MPKILSVIPDSHPQYLDIATTLIKRSPTAFNDITLRYKRHPDIVQLLFHAKDTYDDIYKHFAVQYSMDHNATREFMMHNGLLYLELPYEMKSDPYLAYRAYIQNDVVYPFIPKHIKELFREEGTIMIPKYKTKYIMAKKRAWKGIKTILEPILRSSSEEELPVVLKLKIVSYRQLKKKSQMI